jgi:hypothetical protein
MKKPPVIHPYLFALYPALALLAHNITFVPVKDSLLPLLVVCSATALLFIIIAAILRDRIKAGILTSFTVVMCFSYGHLYYLAGRYLFFFSSLAHKVVFLTCIVIFAIASYFCIRTGLSLLAFTRFLNRVAVILVMIPLINIIFYTVETEITLRKLRFVTKNKLSSGITTITSPSIYYIILDGYAREDVLRQLYHYENSGFIRFLREKGFYVADASKSNYCQTFLSLASSLNAEYLDSFVKSVGEDNSNHYLVRTLIQHNAVFDFVRKHGYKVYVFPSGYFGSEFSGQDIYYPKMRNVTLFHNELINLTPAPFLFSLLNPENRINPYQRHRERILGTLISIQALSKTQGHLFVFAHIMFAHPPFVFTKDGNAIDSQAPFSIADGNKMEINITPEEYRQQYVQQLMFLTKKLEQTIELILAFSFQPPVIILQADHGPGSMLHCEDAQATNIEERFSILNAYYLPQGDDTGLYATITPVNTFRVIFNHSFGARYELLEDKSYFSTWSKPYKLIPISSLNRKLFPEELKLKE